MGEIDTNFLESRIPGFQAACGSSILGASEFRGELRVTIAAAGNRSVLGYLKKHPQVPFSMMMDLFGMDYLKIKSDAPERFAVVYNLYSLKKGERIHVKAFVPETSPQIASIHDLFAAANWFERETWDLFGITFTGHPNLVRILCHTEFEGHPLRKDYPSDGYQRLKRAAPPAGF